MGTFKSKQSPVLSLKYLDTFSLIKIQLIYLSFLSLGWGGDFSLTPSMTSYLKPPLHREEAHTIIPVIPQQLRSPKNADMDTNMLLSPISDLMGLKVTWIPGILKIVQIDLV